VSTELENYEIPMHSDNKLQTVYFAVDWNSESADTHNIMTFNVGD